MSDDRLLKALAAVITAGADTSLHTATAYAPGLVAEATAVYGSWAAALTVAGLRPYRQRKPKPAIPLARLGTCSDATLAAEYGTSVAWVAQCRREAGIPTYRGSRAATEARGLALLGAHFERLGVDSDRQIATAADVAVVTVFMLRRALKIPAAKPGKRPKTTTTATLVTTRRQKATPPPPLVTPIPYSPEPRATPEARIRARLGPLYDDLGEIPDTEMALRAGVSRERVRQWRVALGIPSSLAKKTAVIPGACEVVGKST